MFVRIAALMFCLLGVTAPGQANVLLFTIDSCRADRFGTYGHDRNTTPRIDAWARSGTVFTRAYSTSAWTAPGLVSLLTGLYPRVHGIDNRDRMGPANLQTLSTLFREKGYRTPNLNFFTFAPYYRRLGLGPVEREYLGADETQTILNWLEANAGAGVERDSPFFLWFHTTLVHQPYRPDASALPAPREELEKSPGIKAVLNGAIVPFGSTQFRDEDRPVLDALYEAELKRVDDLFGKVLDLLESRGLLETTLIILTADHGEELLDHGFVGHASTSLQAKLYEELVHIPLILSGPGRVPAGVVVSDPVSQVDLLPTVARLCNLQLPPGVQGLDLFESRADRTLFFESVIAGNQTTREREHEWVRAIRKGRWKHLSGGEIYDLLLDPGEKLNLADERPELGEKLEKELADFLARSDQLRQDLFGGPSEVYQAPQSAECPRIYTPGDGTTLEYDVHTGALLMDWQGDMETVYLIEYDIGAGDHHVAGTYEMRGNHQILGPFPRELWADLKAWNPFKIRVSPKQGSPCWSNWVEFRF